MEMVEWLHTKLAVLRSKNLQGGLKLPICKVRKRFEKYEAAE